MDEWCHLRGWFLRLSSAFPELAIKVGKKCERVLLRLGALSLSLSHVIGACGVRLRSLPDPSLTSSHFLFINGNSEKQAGGRGHKGSVRGKKTFTKITIFLLGLAAAARPAAPALFLAPKRPKSGEIQFDSLSLALSLLLLRL